MIITNASDLSKPPLVPLLWPPLRFLFYFYQRLPPDQHNVDCDQFIFIFTKKFSRSSSFPLSLPLFYCTLSFILNVSFVLSHFSFLFHFFVCINLAAMYVSPLPPFSVCLFRFCLLRLPDNFFLKTKKK